ncbi:MAG: hypothetical protein M3Z05_20780 [Gemmatimonadota bacterium]|nr:hypothetical protein [Gemmatimonadota bacterium]
MGKGFKRVNDESGVLIPKPAVGTLFDMVAQRGDAETGLAIDQEVDLVGE